MYYGHIRGNDILLTGIVRKSKGYTIEFLFKKSKKQSSLPLSEIVIMLDKIPNYEITEWFQGMITPMCSEGNKLAELIKSDLKSGKCTIVKSVGG